MRKPTAAQLEKLDKLPQDLVRRLQRTLVGGYYQNLIAQGELDPTGKTANELALEFFQKLRTLVRAPGFGVKLIVVHSESILEEARRFGRQGRREMSLLFYATWFEHWINGLIDAKARPLKLTERALKLILRQTGLEAKFVCFPLLAGLPAVKKGHLNSILRCSELRNAFVHYKYSVHSNQQTEDEEAEQKKAITAAEKAVKYLTRYEQRYLFKGAKKKIHKVFWGVEG